MPTDLLLLAVALWLLVLVLAACGVGRQLVRAALSVGSALLVVVPAWLLPHAMAARTLPWSPVPGMRFILTPAALWLLGFGALVALFATASGTPSPRWRSWSIGAALCLLGALGCFGLQDAVGLLVAWEIMSLGGAVLLIGERLGEVREGHGLLFMLALLEVGAVALLAALLMLAHVSGGTDFAAFAHVGTQLGTGLRVLVGLLLLIGFGAKLGLLPFYEWYPDAYGQGSGASGALLSGIVLNAAFFALQRAFTDWLPGDAALAQIVVAVGVLSAILAALYAFQEGDWRRLLSFSSAENAAIAVTLLGASEVFRGEQQLALASLAWTVALLHLAGHALAKGALMLAADGACAVDGDYAISSHGLLRRSMWLYGVGVVFAGMSLAAMPPQAGFVSEWFTFQTLFQGFHLAGMGARLTLSLAGAGMALTAAVAFATFVKLVGLGALGNGHDATAHVGRAPAWGCGLLGLCVLALAIGMPWWLGALDGAVASHFAGQGSAALRDGWILVPLSSHFAFISPTKLVIVCPLLAIVPLVLLLISRSRHRMRKTQAWFGGVSCPPRGRTTSLTFSNALRTFYSFVYRPTAEVEHEHRGREYFVHTMRYRARVSPLFEDAVFRGPTRLVQWVARVSGPLQSGRMNVYLGLVGALLVAIFALALA